MTTDKESYCRRLRSILEEDRSNTLLAEGLRAKLEADSAGDKKYFSEAEYHDLSFQDALREVLLRWDIIYRTENSMVIGGRAQMPYKNHVDEMVARCLREIANKEGEGKFAEEILFVASFADKALSQWMKARGDLRGYVELSQYVEERFRRYYEGLKLEQQRTEELVKERQELAKERRCEEYEQCLSRNRSLVNKFLEIADRRVSALDDYGDENWDALPKEIQTCLHKMVKIENHNGVTERGDVTTLAEKYRWLEARLESEFRQFHEQRALNAPNPVFDELSGMEFETYLSRLLRQNGFEDIRGTAATGDQGADLIAKKAGRTIVVQAKRYQGPVGNKAVQEVVAAVKFYRADEGWVITSSTFTPSAKALANANGVKLIDGYSLRNGLLGLA